MNPNEANRQLECGCRFEGKRGETGKFYPCGPLHRDIALRYRTPGATWVVVKRPPTADELDEAKP